MEPLNTVLGIRLEGGCEHQPGREPSKTNRDRWAYAMYVLALVVSICNWLPGIRASLWLDETGTFWVIEKGFREIWSRGSYLHFPTYYYILWFGTKLIGTSEAALRVPSVLAMAGAVYLLYLAARELFAREVALIAAIIFSLHPIVMQESIDARPYAFAVLTTNAAIYLLLRLRRSNSIGLAAVFGVFSALILYFHFLFGVILPAFLVCFILIKRGNRQILWRQMGIMLAAFMIFVLPLIPDLASLFHAPKTHVFEASPNLLDLVFLTIVPFWWLPALGLTILGMNAKSQSGEKYQFERWQVLICLLIALIPILILYGVSAATPIHIFIGRHRLVAIPGISLCWAMMIGSFQRRNWRALFCAVLVVSSVAFFFNARKSAKHSDSWKHALQVVEKSASADNAPVVICSDFPEADYISMPLGKAKESRYFAQLSYYKISVPVIPMPRGLNGEAMRVGAEFLHHAEQVHERFFAMAFRESYPTLDWLKGMASSSYSVRELGVYNEIKVLEFEPVDHPVMSAK